MTFDRSLTHSGIRSIDWRAWGSLALLGSAWLWLNHETLSWFIRLPQQLSTLNLLIFLGVALVCAGAWLVHREKDSGGLEFGFRRSPLILLFGSASLSILLRWQLNLDSLPGACFILGTYGLIGLAMSPKRWKQWLPLAGAIALLVGTALGPLPRSFIAEIVESLLSPFQIHALSSENILVLDNGIAFIDLPCSGRKSLWTGSLFLIAATLLERRQIRWRWFGVFLANLGLLLTANIARILMLVVVTYGLHQEAIAEMIHIPFGLVSFITVCFVSWGLLRWIPQYEPSPLSRTLSQAPPFSIKTLVLTLSLLIGLSLIPTPVDATVSPSLLTSLPLQEVTAVKPEPLNPVEERFFANYPGVVAQKQSFDFDGRSGSMVLVTSPTWEAHHSPELCLTGSGYRVNHMEKLNLAPEVTGRWLSLDDGNRNAAYWFQSSQRTTDSYLDRLVSEITRQDSQWTLVSILFDQSVQPESVQSLIADVHGAIATRLS